MKEAVLGNDTQLIFFQRQTRKGKDPSVQWIGSQQPALGSDHTEWCLHPSLSPSHALHMLCRTAAASQGLDWFHILG